MHCPVCRHDDTKVIDSRSAEAGMAIRRRRSCPDCSYRFTTYERLESAPLMVMKRSGTREPFDRVKVSFGVQSACKGRPVTEEQIEALAEQVEDDMRLAAAAGTEITSSTVGVDAITTSCADRYCCSDWRANSAFRTSASCTSSGTSRI